MSLVDERPAALRRAASDGVARRLAIGVACGLVTLGCAAACLGILSVILLRWQNFGDANDFLDELWIPYTALHAGQLQFFSQHAPSYIGAVLERAPFAMVALDAGTGWRLTYLASAVPCYVAPPIFGLWLATRLRPPGTQRLVVTAVVIGVTVLDPLIWFAGIQGHPEELLGATLALAAVLCAAGGQGLAAIVLIVVAVLNKPGLAELIPVVIAAMRGRVAPAGLLLCLFGSLSYLLYTVTSLHSTYPVGQLTMGALSIGAVPFQLLWWLGDSSWPVTHEHLLIAPTCVALVVLWRVVVHPRLPASGAARLRAVLWLTAFVLVCRDAVEPGNTTYYSVPIVFALLCIDLQRSWVPRTALIASAAALLVVPQNRIIPLSPDGQAGLYAAVVVPALLFLAWRTYVTPLRSTASERAASSHPVVARGEL